MPWSTCLSVRLIHVLSLDTDYHIQMNEMITANQDLSKHAIFVEQVNQIRYR